MNQRTVRALYGFGILLSGLAAAAGAEDSTIPGSSALVSQLTIPLDWEFSVESDGASGWRRLHGLKEGPTAEASRVFSLRSKEPYEKTESGAYYLRLRLTAWRYSGEEEARAAMQVLADWLQRDDDTFLKQKQGGYWVQERQWVYELSMGCMFSEQNYELVVDQLNRLVSSSDDQTSPGVQCYCGGYCEVRGAERLSE